MSSAATPRPCVTARVPAKVNLELMVGPRRADGFHHLATVFQAVGLHDDITVEAADDWGVTVNGPYADQVPADDTNLAMRAARMLASEAGIDGPVHITIDKDIPVAAGLAGGSADAAGALLACDALWGCGPRRQRWRIWRPSWAAMSRSRSWAVPRWGQVAGTSSHRCWGEAAITGCSPSATSGSRPPRCMPSATGCAPTPRVPEPVPSASMMTALRSGDAASLGRALSNDLQPAALSLQPRLEEVLHGGLDNGALGGIVSGSGPTVAFLVSDTERGLDLAVALTTLGVAPAVKRAVGPVRGAHLITAAAGPRGSVRSTGRRPGQAGPAGLRSS